MTSYGGHLLFFSVTPIVTSGTKIATITSGSNNYDIYSPDSSGSGSSGGSIFSQIIVVNSDTTSTSAGSDTKYSWVSSSSEYNVYRILEKPLLLIKAYRSPTTGGISVDGYYVYRYEFSLPEINDTFNIMKDIKGMMSSGYSAAYLFY